MIDLPWDDVDFDDEEGPCCEWCGHPLDDGSCPICNPYGDCAKCGDPLEWHEGKLICQWCDWGIG